MTRQQILSRVCALFSQEGYAYYASQDSRACFDVMATDCSHRETLLVKALENVDGFTREMNDRLARISTLLDAWSVLIGGCNRAGSLEDGVVYRRYAIDVMSPHTLEQYLTGDQPTLRKEKKLLCELDPEKLKSARRELKMSRPEFSRFTGISEEMLYRYEHGICKPVSGVAEHMENLLGAKLTWGVSPSHNTPSEAGPSPDVSDAKSVDLFLGFRSAYVRNPITMFLGIGTKPGEAEDVKKEVIAIHMSDDTRTISKKTGALKSISNILKSKRCIISNLKPKDTSGIPVLTLRETCGLGKKGLIKFLSE